MIKVARWILVAAALSSACGSSAGNTGPDTTSVAHAGGDNAGAPNGGGDNAGKPNGGGGNAGGSGGAQAGSAGGSRADGTAGASGAPENMAGGSTGGGALTDVVLRCSAPDTVGSTTNPGVRRTVQGANQTLVDSCDANGNLIDYYCESKQTCVPPSAQPDPLPICTSTNTGNVLSQNYNCSGHCMNGTCASRCPAFGDLLSYVAVNATTGAATFENQTDHRRYLCQLTFDEPSDAYDCKAGPTVGLQVKMIAQGLKSSYCTGGDFGGFGVGAANAALTDNPACDYDCVLPAG